MFQDIKNLAGKITDSLVSQKVITAAKTLGVLGFGGLGLSSCADFSGAGMPSGYRPPGQAYNEGPSRAYNEGYAQARERADYNAGRRDAVRDAYGTGRTGGGGGILPGVAIGLTNAYLRGNSNGDYNWGAAIRQVRLPRY